MKSFGIQKVGFTAINFRSVGLYKRGLRKLIAAFSSITGTTGNDESFLETVYKKAISLLLQNPPGPSTNPPSYPTGSTTGVPVSNLQAVLTAEEVIQNIEQGKGGPSSQELFQFSVSDLEKVIEYLKSRGLRKKIQEGETVSDQEISQLNISDNLREKKGFLKSTQLIWPRHI